MNWEVHYDLISLEVFVLISSFSSGMKSRIALVSPAGFFIVHILSQLSSFYEMKLILKVGEAKKSSDTKSTSS